MSSQSIIVGDRIEVLLYSNPLVTSTMPVIYAGQDDNGKVGFVAGKVFAGVCSGYSAEASHNAGLRTVWLVQDNPLDFTAANMELAIEAQRVLFPHPVTVKG